GVGEPRGKDRAQLYPIAVARFNDSIAALQADFQRLLDDDVFAGRGRGDGGFHVRATGRGHDDDIHVAAFQCRGKRWIELAAEFVLGGEAFQGRGYRIHHGNDAGTVYLGQRLQMKSGDHSATHNGEPRHNPSSFLSWPAEEKDEGGRMKDEM